VSGVGQRSPAAAGQGLMSDVSSSVPSAPSQGSTGLAGGEGGSTARGSLDGLGDPIAGLLTGDLLGPQ
jgi:hypothetical protein